MQRGDFKEYFSIYNSKKECIERKLKKISYIVDFAEVLIFEIQRKLSYFFKGKNASILEEKMYNINRYKVFDLVIKEIKSFAKRKDIGVVIVYIPERIYLEKGSSGQLFKRVRSILSGAEVALIDLSDILSKDDYYRYDGHWKPKGHYKVAIKIKNFLIENNLFSKAYLSAD